MVTKELTQYWVKLFNHPLCTEELIDIVRKDIKTSVEFGANEYFYTRNKLRYTLDVLEIAETLSNYGGED